MYQKIQMFLFKQKSDLFSWPFFVTFFRDISLWRNRYKQNGSECCDFMLILAESDFSFRVFISTSRALPLSSSVFMFTAEVTSHCVRAESLEKRVLLFRNGEKMIWSRPLSSLVIIMVTMVTIYSQLTTVCVFIPWSRKVGVTCRF